MSTTAPSFMEAYFDYVDNTEAPKIFHRWAAICGLAAMLGRQFHMPFGIGDIHPNLYVMLLGEPGTRKSTAIKGVARLLKRAGYEHLAAEKTTKEKFLLDLEGKPELEDDQLGESSKMFKNLYGEGEHEELLHKEPREVFVAADEFNDFIGNGDLTFISLLGVLWDYDGEYRSRLKNSKSVAIYQPTVNILSGNTPTSFMLAFPSEAIGQGFLSRTLLIHGEETGIRIPDPPMPDPASTQLLIDTLVNIKEKVAGPALLTPDATELRNAIYMEWPEMEDVRFKSYGTRRYTQLMKLCLLCAADRASTTIEAGDVLLANTILSYAEHFMPKALGELGKGKYSEVSSKIMNILNSAHAPVSRRAIWKQVCNDLAKETELVDVLRGMTLADKVQVIGTGYLPKHKQQVRKTPYVEYSLLREKKEGLL